MKISVFIKEPGKKLRHVNIENSLENLQKTVGGYVEMIRLSNGMAMLMAEEGKLRNMPYNFTTMLTGELYGTIVFCGLEKNDEGEEEFGDVPMKWEEAKRVFEELFEESEEK